MYVSASCSTGPKTPRMLKILSAKTFCLFFNNVSKFCMLFVLYDTIIQKHILGQQLLLTCPGRAHKGKLLIQAYFDHKDTCEEFHKKLNAANTYCVAPRVAVSLFAYIHC